MDNQVPVLDEQLALDEEASVTQAPHPVEVVHTISTDRITEVEIYWHRRFKEKRTNGESFLLTDADVAEFKQHSVM